MLRACKELGIKTVVVDTNTVIDTLSYYKLESISNYGTIPSYGYARLREDEFYVIRLDTSYPAPNHELSYYKKGAIIGDNWENPGPDFPIIYTVLDTFVTIVFGNTHTVKLLEINDGLVLINEYWTEEFGWLSRSDFGGSLGLLQGCVINGTVYGDTTFTIVSVKGETEIPNNFYLAQNYPNPFNPTTKIKYTIPTPPVSSPLVKGRTKEGFVTLKVYDVLGNEIATLVNEEKPAGEYGVEFDGTGLSSGVYFYQLRAGSFVETKKMVLMK